MYIDLNARWNWSTESRIEAVRIAANLRNEILERNFNDEALASNSDGEYPFKSELRLLFDFALASSRPAVARPTRLAAAGGLQFQVENDRVIIGKRKRGAPIDKLVSG